MKELKKARISKIEQLDDFQDEWVYDIGINGDTPYFFGNNILLHNSSYFSVYNAWKDIETKIAASPLVDVGKLWTDYEHAVVGSEQDLDAFLASLDQTQITLLEMMLKREEFEDMGTDTELEAFDAEFNALIASITPVAETSVQKATVGGKYGPMAATFDWTDKDAIIKLYDDIADDTNETFPEFMNRSFHTGLERGAIIAAGREIVAENAMYIKKKRYAALVIDNEGKRYDTDGKPGKLKAMGLETKRSDTPAFVQEFLEEVLIKVLKGEPEDDVLKFIKDFRKGFEAKPGWHKGRPTAIKGLTKYGTKLNAAKLEDIDLVDDEEIEIVNGKVSMPGHVRASINFNNMLEFMNDHATPPIKDGDKVVVCQLKQNPYNIESVARPVDVPDHNLPDWFKKMPFDHEKMENSMIDVKIDNLIGILRWNLKSISDNTTFQELFEVAKTASNMLNNAEGKQKSKKKTKVDLGSAGDLFSF